MSDSSMSFLFNSQALATCAAALLVIYIFLVRQLRYKRAESIQHAFRAGNRPLSSMTTQEAYEIMQQLQQLEFPRAFAKARAIALLKAGAIPTMSKLFAATGQNNRRNAAKRAIDTEILLRETQSQPTDSERYQTAVARINYLHARYRRAGKILDHDLLHTLGSNVVEIFRVVSRDEWRPLSDVEMCAVGVFHMRLGQDLGVPYDSLPSSAAGGWADGLHFATELRDWTLLHEKRAALFAGTNDQYVRVYVDSAVEKFSRGAVSLLRKTLGYELDDTMRTSLGLEAPGLVLRALLDTLREARRFYLRHLSLPRSPRNRARLVDAAENPTTGLYNFSHARPQPWYVAPTWWNTRGPARWLGWALGGRAPGSSGDRFQPGGYDLWSIGPKPQQGRGVDEMKEDVALLQSRGLDRCPFSNRAA